MGEIKGDHRMKTPIAPMNDSWNAVEQAISMRSQPGTWDSHTKSHSNRISQWPKQKSKKPCSKEPVGAGLEPTLGDEE
jgi:hypothetical protein